jgi:predicted lipid-binding transport protein (Tim44 family)
MRRTTKIRYISSNPGGPVNAGGFLGRILAFVVGALVLGAAIFLGAIFIAAVIGMLLIGGLVVASRVWWIKRQLSKQAEQHEQEHGDLNAEYSVIDEQDKR